MFKVKRDKFELEIEVLGKKATLETVVKLFNRVSQAIECVSVSAIGEGMIARCSIESSEVFDVNDKIAALVENNSGMTGIWSEDEEVFISYANLKKVLKQLSRDILEDLAGK